MTIGWNVLSGGAFISSAIPGFFPWRLYLQKDVKLLESSKRKSIEEKIKHLASKLGLKKEIAVIEIKNLWGTAQALGNSFLPCRAGIAIDPELFGDLTEGAQEFVLAHELSHIKSNDMCTMGVFASIIGIITTIAISVLFPTLTTFSSSILGTPAVLIGITVSIVAWVFFSRWREECADKLAFSICSSEGQRDVVSFFEYIQKEQLEFRNSPYVSFLSSIWRKTIINSEGDERFDIVHPSLKTRISYLKTSLAKPVTV